MSRQMEMCIVTAFRNAIYRKGPQPRIIRYTSQRAFSTGQFRDIYLGEYLLWSLLWSGATIAAYKIILYDNWMKSSRIWFEYNMAYSTSSSKYNQALVAHACKYPVTIDNAKDIDFEEYCVNKSVDELPPPPLVDYDVKW